MRRAWSGTGPIRLASWRGWQHERWIYFYHNGGLIVDEAQGSAGARAGLAWHLVDGEEVALGHFRLRSGDAPVKVRLISLSEAG